MSNCLNMRCPHVNTETGVCSFSGNCIVKKYNLVGMENVNNFIRPAEPVVEVTEEVVEEPIKTIVVEPQAGFNPFQRGNGCMLAEMVGEKVR